MSGLFVWICIYKYLDMYAYVYLFCMYNLLSFRQLSATYVFQSAFQKVLALLLKYENPLELIRKTFRIQTSVYTRFRDITTHIPQIIGAAARSESV